VTTCTAGTDPPADVGVPGEGVAWPQALVTSTAPRAASAARVIGFIDVMGFMMG
jgi:hypothetical protein